MLNRALPPYAPGSTFQNDRSPDVLKAVWCRGHHIRPGIFPRTFMDWKPGASQVDLIKALKVSCDTYFYQVGLKIGIDIRAWHTRPGQNHGIELRVKMRA